MAAWLSLPAVGQVKWDSDRADYATGPSASDVVSGDIDGDGTPDLVYVLSGGGRILSRTNLGSGLFGPAVQVNVLAGANTLALGKLDSDGYLDLVVASRDLDSLMVLRGRGQGVFSLKGTFPIPGNPGEVQLVDLDGDLLDEIVIADDLNSQILIGSHAAFGLPISWEAAPVLDPPSRFSIGDLNGDGMLDLVASGSLPEHLGSVLLGTVGSTFGAPSFFPYSFGGGQTFVGLGDFDGDGLLDAMSVEDDGFCSELSLWPGKGDGAFGPATWYSFACEHQSTNVIGDFNGDGELDFASGEGVDSVGMYMGGGILGLGGTAWSISTKSNVSVGASIQEALAADFDMDGAQDLLTLNGGADTMSIFLSRPEPASSYKNTMSVLSGGKKVHHMALQVGPDFGDHPFLILGSLGGTSPGLDLGGVHLPLNPDGYLTFLLLNPNTLISGSVGLLSSWGGTNATLNAGSGPLSPSLIGLTAHHSFLVLKPATMEVAWVSEPLTLQLQ